MHITHQFLHVVCTQLQVCIQPGATVDARLGADAAEAEAAHRCSGDAGRGFVRLRLRGGCAQVRALNGLICDRRSRQRTAAFSERQVKGVARTDREEEERS